MAKPFSIQAPADIATEYGGNKQRIAQAAQMGLIDPTAAVLAGMFIDRMRSAQTMEAAQQPSVAQQVLGGGGAPMPQGASPAMGMGAGPPPSAPSPQPPPAAPPPEMGMAAGGLATLPVSDMMFDDSEYAEGGMVAFSGGGAMSDLYDAVETQESGGDQKAVSPAGARGVMQLMPGTMKDPGFGVPTMAALRKQGLSEEEANRTAGRKYLEAMYSRYSDRVVALAAYNWGPGKVDKWLTKGGKFNELPAETQKYIKKVTGGKGSVSVGSSSSTSTTTTTPSSFLNSPPKDISFTEQLPKIMAEGTEEGMSFFDKIMPPQRRDIRDMMEADARKTLDPLEQKKEKTRDMWEALSEIGFGMAASNSPYFLQAVGEAAKAALPGTRAARKEREANKKEAIKQLAQIEGIDNAEAQRRTDFALRYAETKYGAKKADIATTVDIWKTQATEGEQTKRQTDSNATNMRVAEINADGASNAADKAGTALDKQIQAQATEYATKEVEVRYPASSLRPRDPAKMDEIMAERKAYFDEAYSRFLQKLGYSSGSLAGEGSPQNPYSQTAAPKPFSLLPSQIFTGSTGRGTPQVKEDPLGLFGK